MLVVSNITTRWFFIRFFVYQFAKVRYFFEYTVKDDKISFNFEDDRVKDTDYKYIKNDNTITLTELVGKSSYMLTKK